MDLPTLTVLPSFNVTSEMLELDGVHLNPASGDLFLQHLCSSIKEVCQPPSDVTLVNDVDISSDEDDDDDVQSVRVREDRLGAILRIVKSNSEKLSSVRPLQNTLAKMAGSS
jgi:hypothetical protein